MFNQYCFITVIVATLVIRHLDKGMGFSLSKSKSRFFFFWHLSMNVNGKALPPINSLPRSQITTPVLHLPFSSFSMGCFFGKWRCGRVLILILILS